MEMANQILENETHSNIFTDCAAQLGQCRNRGYVMSPILYQIYETSQVKFDGELYRTIYHNLLGEFHKCNINWNKLHILFII